MAGVVSLLTRGFAGRMPTRLAHFYIYGSVPASRNIVFGPNSCTTLMPIRRVRLVTYIYSFPARPVMPNFYYLG